MLTQIYRYAQIVVKRAIEGTYAPTSLVDIVASHGILFETARNVLSIQTAD